VQSVRNALRVLEEVAARQPVGVGELSRRLGMPKSSVQRALTTLGDAGWLRPSGGELTRWYLTTKSLIVGRASAELGLREAALPVMMALRDQTRETVHLSVREGNAIVLIERVDSPQALRTFNALGRRAPMHASSSGKAMLAVLGDVEREQVLAEGLERYTDQTILDPEELRAELAKIRARGYATNSEEWRPEVAAVGRAIFGGDGEPIAVINISAPSSRVGKSQLSRFGKLLIAATQEIENQLGGTQMARDRR
jgi:IclR family acetate operon transcriptional repressor